MCTMVVGNESGSVGTIQSIVHVHGGEDKQDTTDNESTLYETHHSCEFGEDNEPAGSWEDRYNVIGARTQQ